MSLPASNEKAKDRGEIAASRGLAGGPYLWMVGYLLVLVIFFFRPLRDLVRYSLQVDLYSHILLIPLVTLYFAHLRRDAMESLPLKRSPWSLVFAGLGLGTLLMTPLFMSGPWEPTLNDSLSISMLAFVLLVIAGLFLVFGEPRIRLVAFPVCLLFFMVPFPGFVTHGIEMFFQHTSAEAAHGLFNLTDTPLYRNGLFFSLPGITLKVAEECSGIRSSLVLFIVSLLAGQLFLKSPWKRALLAFLVIPIGIIRNGFRIFTIGMLCVHVDVKMINSPIHHHGGPLFFLISLVPFFLILIWLRKSEWKTKPVTAPPGLVHSEVVKPDGI